MKYLKFLGLFVVLFLALALNLPDNFVARLGFDVNYLLAAGAALLISWASLRHNALMVGIIVLLVIGANVPEETAASLGYDRDIVLAALFGVILLPLIRNFLDLD